MDIQERVLNAFQQEYREHIEAIRGVISGWPNVSAAVLEDIFRMAHSIKGGARVCDLHTVEKLAHYLEHLFAELMRGDVKPTEELRRAVEEVMNAVEDYMTALAEKRTPAEPDELLARIERAEPRKPASALNVPLRPDAVPKTPEPAVQMGSKQEAPRQADTVRVNASHLDRLLQSSGGLITEGIRQAGIERALRELTASVEVLQRRCEAELSSDEVRRFHGNTSISATLDELRRGLSDAGRSLRRVRGMHQESMRAIRTHGEHLQSDARQVRMVPVGSVFEGFSKMVRDLARLEGKQVEFFASGLEREADRLVLQTLRNPVMHALRNAVSHGIELPEQRVALGKAPQGVVRLDVEIRGSQMVVRITDDGHGLDLPKIRQRAVEKGIMSAEEARGLGEEETLDLLFRAGFSTAPAVTNVSGRGMGLSVVKEAAVHLQGSARITGAQPAGSTLIVSTPLSIATHRMLLVGAAGQSFAIPSTATLNVRRVAISEIKSVEGRSVLMVGSQPVLLATLGDLLSSGNSTLPNERGFVQIALLHAGKRLLAVAVEEFLREMAVIIKPLPYPASVSPFFSGGILLEDGSVVLALNVSALVDRFKGAQLEARTETAPMRSVRRKSSVLVVDDSFTARTLQKSILETAGYDVQIAVDGEQALSVLRANSVDAVVTDVQMPRMDGFQLLAEMKKDERLQSIPVVLVTSLSSEEDQARGLALGADAYIVKQKFDHGDLLNVIHQLV